MSRARYDDGRLWYSKDAREATQQVVDEAASAAFLLDGMPAEAIAAVAEAGEVMPYKSTYFTPGTHWAGYQLASVTGTHAQDRREREADPEPPSETTAITGNGRGYHDGDNGRQASKPVRKDEIVLEDRGLYIESWLPERRSRRRPIFYLHGELAGSWLWEHYLRYFAQRGWEGHALNLRGHFWSETTALDELDFGAYLEDVIAGYEALHRPAVVVGHGLGGLLALKLAEAARPMRWCCSARPSRPRCVLVPPPHVVRLVPAIYQAEPSTGRARGAGPAPEPGSQSR
jgi:hypothetical protein